MQELNMPVNMTIFSKLPVKMREQWRTKAHEIMDITNDKAHIIDLVQCIERCLKILSEPLFSDIQDTLPGAPTMKNFNPFKPQLRKQIKGDIVATA